MPAVGSDVAVYRVPNDTYIVNIRPFELLIYKNEQTNKWHWKISGMRWMDPNLNIISYTSLEGYETSELAEETAKNNLKEQGIKWGFHTMRLN